MKKQLIALAVAAAASAGANAGWEATGTNGELMLSVWDPVAKVSVAQDTGVRFNDVVNLAAGSEIRVDLSDWSIFSASNTADIKWSFAAMQEDDSTFDYGVLVTSKAATVNAGIYADLSTGVWPGAFGNLDGQLPDGSANSLNNTYYGSVGSNVYNRTSTFGTNLMSQVGFTLSGALADTLNVFHHYIEFNEDYTVDTGVADRVTTAYIDLATRELVIGYAEPVSEVPVPAAAWLLASGLAGLGAISRRKKANA